MLTDAPLVLALETATPTLSVALVRGPELLVERQGESGHHHAQTLLPLVDAALGEAGVRLADVEAHAVSIGPGAFTSLRIGLATVKGLAFGSRCPVAPVSTLHAMAFEAAAVLGSKAGSHLVPLLDARRGEAYGAVYARRDGVLEAVVADAVHRPEALARELPETCTLVGEGAPLFAPLLCAERPGARLGPTDPPRARAVAAVGLEILRAGGGVDVRDLAPHYVRRAEAEVLRAERAARPDS